MNKDFKINEILSAVDSLLESKNLNKVNHNESPLLLQNEIKPVTRKNNRIPENTEKIILQAEKFLKK